MLKSLTSETRKMMTPPLMIGTGAAMALGSPALLTLAGAYAVNSYAW